MPRRDRLHVVIAGGGVAALETLLALRALAGHLVDVTLVSPTPEFVYRPVTVAEAFDRAQARVYDLAEILADQSAGELVHDTLADVETRSRIAVTVGGERISYDALVVATGAVPGAPFPGAFTFRGRDDVPALRGLLHDLTTARAGSVALALPSERMWPLPLYELALMTAAHLSEHGAGDVRVTLVTPEEEPLALFGPAATDAVCSLLEAQGIIVRSSSLPAVARGRVLLLAGGAEVFADRVITLPVLEGPRLSGLPHDQHGFIPVDKFGRVSDVEHVFAAGDVTAFPLKQGGLAAQQADAVAEAIAALAGAVDYAQAVPPRAPRTAAHGRRAALPARGAPPARPRGDGRDRSTRGSPALARRLGGRRTGAVVAAGEDRRPIPGSVPRDRAAVAAQLGLARRPGPGTRPAGERRRAGGGARARAAARRLRRALGRLPVGSECARCGRSAAGRAAPRVRGQAARVARRRPARQQMSDRNAFT